MYLLLSPSGRTNLFLLISCPESPAHRHSPFFTPLAGAHQVDIRNALKGHPLSEELADLIGPEPEEPEVSQDAPTEESTTAPKGLPALPSKSKKKEAEAAA